MRIDFFHALLIGNLTSIAITALMIASTNRIPRPLRPFNVGVFLFVECGRRARSERQQVFLFIGTQSLPFGKRTCPPETGGLGGPAFAFALLVMRLFPSGFHEVLLRCEDRIKRRLEGRDHSKRVLT